MKIRNREGVINLILERHPSRSVLRAITEGTVEFLGGFSPVPPGSDPGWILRCNSPITYKHWNVAVVAKDGKANYVLRLVQKIPWQNWVGDTGNPRLYRGDHPEKYMALRDEIRGILDDKEERT